MLIASLSFIAFVIIYKIDNRGIRYIIKCEILAMEEKCMIKTIEKVFADRNEIIAMAKAWQTFNLTESHTDEKYEEKRQVLFDFFDKYSNNEVKVIQSIMYLGRDCYTEMYLNKYSNVVELIEAYFYELSFTWDGDIDKDIEIDQMVSKGLKIGDYFSEGFKAVETLM